MGHKQVILHVNLASNIIEGVLRNEGAKLLIHLKTSEEKSRIHHNPVAVNHLFWKLLLDSLPTLATCYKMKLIPFLRGLRSFTSSSKISTLSLQRRHLHAGSVAKDSQSNPVNLDPFGPRPPPSDKIVELADRIASLPLEELKQMGPALQSLLMYPKLQQISSGGFNLGPQTGATAAKAEEKKAEKTAFDVKLEKFDAAAKIKVIKEVRSFTSLGLKEAKDLVEKAPIVLKQGVTKEEANDIIEKIKAVGGVAVME